MTDQKEIKANHKPVYVPNTSRSIMKKLLIKPLKRTNRDETPVTTPNTGVEDS